MKKQQHSAPTGTWHCHFVDQFQSDASRGDGDPHPDHGMSPPSPASETEYRSVTLEIDPAGTYTLKSPERELSSGTWTMDDARLALAPSDSGDFGGLHSVTASPKAIVVAFHLIPDAHDGLDVISFDLRPKPPKATKRSLSAADVVERLTSGKWNHQQQSKLDQLDVPDRVVILRGVWDAFAAGALGADPSAPSHPRQLEFLRDSTQLDVPVATHAHVVHALKTLDDNGRWLLGTAIVKALCALPESSDDGLVRDALDAGWYERLAHRRLLVGAPDVWSRSLFDAASLDEATRTYLRDPRVIYGTRFDEVTKLFEGRELASVAMRHYGQGALTRAHGVVTRGRLEGYAREAAAATLTELEPAGANVLNDVARNTRRLLALALAVLFREDPSTLPADVLRSLAYPHGYSQAVMEDADKALLSAACAGLSDAEKAAVKALFHLDAP